MGDRGIKQPLGISRVYYDALAPPIAVLGAAWTGQTFPPFSLLPFPLSLAKIFCLSVFGEKEKTKPKSQRASNEGGENEGDNSSTLKESTSLSKPTASEAWCLFSSGHEERLEAGWVGD